MEHYEIQAEYERDGITFTVAIAQDDTAVRGNAMASGDDAADREVEDAILARLEDGDAWAWCVVRVTASVDGFEGADYLGACCFEDYGDFAAGGYLPDMENDARGELLGNLEAAALALEKTNN